MGGRFAGAWSTLLKYVQTGQAAYQDVFGLPFWNDLNAHPEIGASFDAMIGPAGHGQPNAEFEITGGWDDVRMVADVGGGTGAMLAGILKLHPHVRGMLIDQPRTVALSTKIFQVADVMERVTVHGQSFFDPLPKGADIYVLRGILNDFPDREAMAILQRCAEAAKPNGRVVILGGVMPDDTPRGISIEMVLLGGKQRSLSEFSTIAQATGVEIMTADRQASEYFVVECRPI
jgi:2,7-dihydroxy-5-methyl-1-naphthoate 7-O-methyltransferase